MITSSDLINHVLDDIGKPYYAKAPFFGSCNECMLWMNAMMDMIDAFMYVTCYAEIRHATSTIFSMRQ